MAGTGNGWGGNEILNKTNRRWVKSTPKKLFSVVLTIAKQSDLRPSEVKTRLYFWIKWITETIPKDHHLCHSSKHQGKHGIRA